MAYRTEFIHEGRGALHKGLEIITGAEIIDGSAHTLQAVQAGMPMRYAFVDFSDCTRFDISPDEIKSIARINLALAEIRREICVAIVAPSDHAFGMARMWEAHATATDWATYVFREAGKARGWLVDRTGDSSIVTTVEAGAAGDTWA